MTTAVQVPPAAVVRPAARRTPGWWRDAAEVCFGASLVVVALLWLGGGGLRDLAGGVGEALMSLGRALGLVASDLLLVQVLLMARLPFVERSFGQDDLARRHRVVGSWSFWLMAAHVLLVTVGYAVTDGRNPLSELWDLTWTYPGMLLAVAGTLCLVMVTVTSIRAARRRLRYESWHLLHLYAYLGAGLALPHQLWSGGDFVGNPVAAAWWWSAWAGTAAAVVVWRLGVPVWRTLRHRLVVAAVVPEAPGVVSVHLTGRRLDALPARAGQFLLFRFLDGTGRTRAHPYSLSASPHPGLLRVTVKDLGDGSRRVAGLRPGTRVAVEGPYGRLTADRRTRRGVLLVGSGVGITPLRSLAEELEQSPGDVVLLHRVHSEADAVFRGELAQLATTRGLRVVRLVGPRPPGRASWLPAAHAARDDVDALRRLVPDVADRDVFVCGPAGWTDLVLTAVRAAGVPDAHVHVERFSW